MKLGRVYMIISPSGKVYIGSTSTTCKKRWSYYKALDCKRQVILYNSLLKYGHSNHIFKEIWEGNIDNMLKTEHVLGKFWNVLDNKVGLNCMIPSIDEKFKGVSDETRRRMSESKLGEKNYFYKKQHTEETKRKLSDSKMGQKAHNKKYHTKEEWVEASKIWSKTKRDKNNPNRKIKEKPYILNRTVEEKEQIKKEQHRLWRLKNKEYINKKTRLRRNKNKQVDSAGYVLI